jgi:hypothetical protein
VTTAPQVPVPAQDEQQAAAAIAELARGGGLVHGCGCGTPHPYSPSALDTDPARWRRIRVAILERDGRRCQVPTGTAPGQVCGAPATVAGHVLARVLGGCDHPRNLRAECKPHSAPDGARIGNQLRAVAAAVVRARNLTHGDEAGSLDGGAHPDPAMKKLPLPMIDNANVQVSGVGSADADLNTRSTTGAGAAVRDRAVISVAEPNTHSDVAAGHLAVPGPADPVWNACRWLDDLRDVPPEGSWPRLMTLPHPEAVGSYGHEVDAQYERRTGRRLRWWQRLVNARVLEHDEAGRLVWHVYLLSTSRQVGKSTDLRELMDWRTRQVDRWGPQVVMHTGRDLAIVQEVMQPAMVMAERAGASVSWVNGKWELERQWPAPTRPCPTCGGEETPEEAPPCPECRGDGVVPTGEPRSGRWLSRAHRAVYGYSSSNPVVDEAWEVPPRAVNDGLYPLMVEQTSPQLALISTAHPRATGLMLDRRATALAQLFTPADVLPTLLLEWSAAAGRHGRGDGPDLDDRRRWRQASPHWSAQREAMIAQALEDARNGGSDPEDPDPIGSFRCQWLNQWPQDVESVPDPEERLATDEEWARLVDAAAAPGPFRPVVLAVEDDLGRGAAAAAAALTADGRVVVGGWNFPTLREAVDWCEDTAAGAEDAVLLAGASLCGDLETPMDPELEGVELTVEPSGASETRAGLPLVRALVRGGRLAHDGAEDVSRAVLDARVKVTQDGTAMLMRGTETALVRCVAWAVRRAHRDRD